MSRITCDGVDITKHVAAMYDAIIDSLDWGSEFLDADEIASILTVAKLAGWKPGQTRRVLPGDAYRGPSPHATNDLAERDRRIEAHRQHTDAAVAKWQAQVDAMVAANIAAARDGEP